MFMLKFIQHLATGFIAVLAAGISTATGELTENDRTDLATLYQSFSASDSLADYPKYLDDLSLKKCMSAHRSYLNLYLRIRGEAELGKSYTFTPDLETVLQERDPAKYFAGIRLVDPSAVKRIAPPAKIVGITGDGESAFIITELPPLKGKEEDGPDYQVYPALHTPKGWKLDATSTLVHELQALVRRAEKASISQDPESDK